MPSSISLLVVGGLVATLLSACGTQSTTTDPGADAGVEPTITGSATPPSVDDWRPTTIIIPKVFTEEESLLLRQQWLDRLAEQDGIADSVTDVPLERWTNPADNDSVIAACLTDAGFPAQVDPTGGISYGDTGPTKSQMPAFNLAQYICYSRFTLEPKYVQEFDENQLRALYEYWTEFYVPCLEFFGLQEPNDPPSKEAFVTRFLDLESQEPRWIPGDSLQSVSPDRGLQIQVTCPSMPPAQYLYG